MWCKNESGRARHILTTPSCAAAQARDVEFLRTTREAARRAGVRMPLRTGVSWADAEGADDFPFPIVRLNSPMEDVTVEDGADARSEEGRLAANTADAHGSPPPPPQHTPPRASPYHPVTVEEVLDEGDNPTGAAHGPASLRHPVRVEEIPDEGDNLAGVDMGGDAVECGEPFVEEFSDPRAGVPIDDSGAEPFDLHMYMKSIGHMASPKIFEDVELLLTTKMTNEARDRHLKSRRYRGQTPWPNVGALMRDVDKLPHGPPWKAVTLNVPLGDDEERVVVMYVRDIIAVIRELVGNPQFKRYMRYAPEQHWTSKARCKRVFGEMWTGDWWWTMQMILTDPQATIAPLIIVSDKTSLSLISGEQVAYPVYLTIGNISKRIRRKLKAQAQILIGYLPVEDFSDVKNKKERNGLKGKLVHRAMEILLEPLKQASREGVEIYCADGRLRRVYLILAAYIADFPEQCLMACTSQGRCPICTAAFRKRAQYRRKPGRRHQKRDLEALRSYLGTGDLKELDECGLKPWWPFWAHLPHVEFAGCVTPDLLHQLHKGMFKSHLVKWVSRVLGKTTVDDWMVAMTQASSMRHFKKGISKVEKWTGRESKEMAMQFLLVVAETMTDDLVRLTRAMLDHMYRAHAARMTEDELDKTEAAWREFHRLKASIVAAGALTSMRSFNRISKLHTVGHWPPSVRELGTPDGYNSEAPEHLHIEYAKEPWRRSNGVDALPQMIKFIQQQEVVRMHQAHMDAWLALIRRKLAIVEGEGDDSGSDDGGGEYDNNDWEDMGHSEEQPDASATHYPAPRLAIATSPTRANLSANRTAAMYKATDMIPALNRFLESTVAATHGRSRPNQWDHLQVPYLSVHSLFNVWHRFALYHAPLPFAPDEPRRRNVVRARPATRNTFGLPGRQAAFDTVLYRDPAAPTEDVHGLHRYRAVRVRLIFKPPNTAQHIYCEHLAYIEYFTPFSRTNNTPHGLYTTSTCLRPDSRRQVAVVPISHLHMTCHIVPWFAQVDPDICLNNNTVATL